MSFCDSRLMFDTYDLSLSHKCIPDSVDLRTKRRVFDIIMSVRRLEEEQKILVAEMDHHWKSLSTRADTLRELSRMFASETMRSMYL